MNIYDTLVVGSGFFSVGFCSANKNSIIVEERQICDTGFYLPMRSFRCDGLKPITDSGRRLLDTLNSLSLVQNGQHNINGFEYALCKYIIDQGIDVMLKCRVVSVNRQSDGIFDVTVQTNEGLTHLYAKNILNTVQKSENKKYTVLFVSHAPSSDSDKLLELFPGAEIENAFYKDRYALHIPVEAAADENLVKLWVYEQWSTQNTDAKILYMSPTFYYENVDSVFSDFHYSDPVSAFEGGYSFGLGGGEK